MALDEPVSSIVPASRYSCARPGHGFDAMLRSICTIFAMASIRRKSYIETPDARYQRRRKNMQKHKLPHLVADMAERGGLRLRGPFPQEAGLSSCGKHSIYVHHEHMHSHREIVCFGVGGCLRCVGFTADDGYMTPQSSVPLQTARGVRFSVRWGYLPAIGFKFGQWTDTILCRGRLARRDSAPDSVL